MSNLSELENISNPNTNTLLYAIAKSERYDLLKKAYSRFITNNAYKKFVKENQYWLKDYALFMSLKEKLADDLKAAMKDKNVVRKNAVQMVRAGVLQIEKDKKITLDDEGVLDVIAKQLKQRRDSLPDYEKSGREDLIAELKAEMDVLMEYLPAQLSKEELSEIVKQAVITTGASSMKDMGKVMAEVMPKTKGRADGKMINEIAKAMLAQ